MSVQALFPISVIFAVLALIFIFRWNKNDVNVTEGPNAGRKMYLPESNITEKNRIFALISAIVGLLGVYVTNSMFGGVFSCAICMGALYYIDKAFDMFGGKKSQGEGNTPA